MMSESCFPVSLEVGGGGGPARPQPKKEQRLASFPRSLSRLTHAPSRCLFLCVSQERAAAAAIGGGDLAGSPGLHLPPAPGWVGDLREVALPEWRVLARWPPSAPRAAGGGGGGPRGQRAVLPQKRPPAPPDLAAPLALGCHRHVEISFETGFAAEIGGG